MSDTYYTHIVHKGKSEPVTIPYYYSKINGAFYIAFNERVELLDGTTVTLSDEQVATIRGRIDDILREKN